LQITSIVLNFFGSKKITPIFLLKQLFSHNNLLKIGLILGSIFISAENRKLCIYHLQIPYNQFFKIINY